jgi:hypothetical protein
MTLKVRTDEYFLVTSTRLVHHEDGVRNESWTTEQRVTEVVTRAELNSMLESKNVSAFHSIELFTEKQPVAMTDDECWKFRMRHKLNVDSEARAQRAAALRRDADRLLAEAAKLEKP